MTQTPSRRRARPMDAEERRQHIVEAVVPLLASHGDAVTTRQIADAAGVAEGTIFRVFADKRSLFLAVAEHVLNPPDGDEEMAASLNGVTDLRARVELVAERMVQRSQQVMAVMGGLRRVMLELHAGEGHPHEKHAHDKPAGPPAFIRDAHTALLRRLTVVFEPHRDELAVPPEQAALVLRSLVLGSRQPGIDPAQTLSAHDIAEVVLGGVTKTGRAAATQDGER